MEYRRGGLGRLKEPGRQSEVLKLAQRRAAMYGGLSTGLSVGGGGVGGDVGGQAARRPSLSSSLHSSERDGERAPHRHHPRTLAPMDVRVHVSGARLGAGKELPETSVASYAATMDSARSGGKKKAAQATFDDQALAEERLKLHPKDRRKQNEEPPEEEEFAMNQEQEDEITKKENKFAEFDEQAKWIMSTIEADGNSTFKFDQAMQLMKSRSAFNPLLLVKNAIDDFLVPPQVKPFLDADKAVIMAERQLAEEIRREREAEAEERRQKKARGENVETEAEKQQRLAMMRAGNLTAPEVNFGEKFPNGPPTNYARGPYSEEAIVDIAYTREPKAKYTGDRKGGAREGHGMQIFDNGDRYEGEWLTNVPDGYGVLTKKTGEVYEGQWSLGKQCGLGVYRTKDGSSYQGQWANGTMSGFGEWQDRSNGTIFSGEWRNGDRHGYGTKAWLRTGNVYVGRWKEGHKDGDGILKSATNAIGIGRFMCRWKDGVLVARETYDALHHGAESAEASSWASHYAKEAAIDAGLVKDYKAPFPAVPERPKRDMEITAINPDDWPDWVKAFRATFDHSEPPQSLDPEVQAICLQPRERVDQLEDELRREKEADEDRNHKTGQQDKNALAGIDPNEKHIIPAREFKRLITLVHSSDQIVEDLMLPILNGAKEIEGLPDGQESYEFGGLYRVNMEKLKEHFACKIQRQWRRCAIRRSLKVMNKRKLREKEKEEERQKMLEEHFEREHEAIRNALIMALEEDKEKKRLTIRDTDSEGVMLLKKASKALFKVERQAVPALETNARILLSQAIYEKVKGESRGTDFGSDAGSDYEFGTATEKSSVRGAKTVGTIDNDSDDEIEPITPIGKSRADKKSLRVDPSLFPQLEKDRREAEARALEKQERVRKEKEFKRRLKEKRQGIIDEEDSGSDDGEQQEMLLNPGKLRLADGSTFSGQLCKGYPQGYGKCVYPDGGIYAGQFDKGARHGQGQYSTSPDTQGGVENAVRTYYGEWEAGDRHGFGVEIIVAGGEKVSTIAAEYRDNLKVAVSFLKKGDHQEWIDSVHAHALAGHRAAFQASNEAPPVAVVALAVSDHFEFSLQEGVMKYGGEWDRGGHKTGVGVQRWDDGTMYAGEWKVSKPHGSGREKYPDGSSYLGQFRDGRRHGFGRYLTKTGMSYLGDWKNGIRDGQGLESLERHGVVEWKALVEYDEDQMEHIEAYHPRKAKNWLDRIDVAIREAARTAGKAYPAAHIQYEPGNAEKAKMYVGGQYDRVRMGSGIMMYEDKKYVGEWLDDVMDGYGVETYPDDSVYTGELRKGMRHGSGRYNNVKMGRIYTGDWFKGLRHGKGWERVHVSMASGLVIREFLVEYERDYEVSRKLLQHKNHMFIFRATEAVERAETAVKIAMDSYADMLD